MKHDFVLTCADTDSITVCRKDGGTFTDTELETLTAELNSLFPADINWEFEFYIPKMIIFKAKNYAMYDGKKIKTKGSGLKDSKREIALKELGQELLNALVFDKTHEEIQGIYLKYVKEVRDGIVDIKRWCSKKTLTDKIWSSPRENEAKVLRAIEGTEYKEADKVWVFYLPNEELCLMEKFAGEYHKDKMYEKLYKAVQFFTGVIPSELFINYKLKRNQKLLETL